MPVLRDTSQPATNLPQGPGELKVTDLPDPVPKDNEYLIQVHSAAANFFDILQVQGKYQNQPRSFLPTTQCRHITYSNPPSQHSRGLLAPNSLV
mgnify:CR=1 FL=1